MDNYSPTAIFTFVRCGGITASWGWDHSGWQSSTHPHNIPAYFSTYFPQGWSAHSPTYMGFIHTAHNPYDDYYLPIYPRPFINLHDDGGGYLPYCLTVKDS